MEQLADALTACFEGYIMPAHFKAPLVASMIRAEGVDLASSLIATEDGQIGAAALIARRGRISRVAAMGVAKPLRRRGLGRQIMTQAIEEAKSRNDTWLYLEVIEQNPAAISLYESVGFQKGDRLLGFKKQLSVETLTGREVEDVAPDEVADALRERGWEAASWSMSATTVANMATPSHGVKLGDVYAMIGPPVENVIGCRSMAFKGGPTVEKAKIFLEGLGARFPDHQFRMPAFFPEPEFKEAMTGAGMEIDEISQFKMALEL